MMTQLEGLGGVLPENIGYKHRNKGIHGQNTGVIGHHMGINIFGGQAEAAAALFKATSVHQNDSSKATIRRDSPAHQELSRLAFRLRFKL